jgi:hypothetical protein
MQISWVTAMEDKQDQTAFVMQKREVQHPDGRYVIFYEFIEETKQKEITPCQS